MDNKITIGLFIDTFFPMIDGVIMCVDNYAKRLVDYANVIVFAPDNLDGDFDDSKLSYKVVRCKALKMPIIDYELPIPKLDLAFKKELKKYKLDIVHIHSPFMIGKIGIEYAKEHNIPVIATMHSQFRQDFQRAVKSKKAANFLNEIIINVFNKCDECWAVNSEVARIFYEDYGCKEYPKVMNNATEMKPIKNKEEAKNEINKKYKLKNSDRVFLFVGRINALKNIFFIVDALKLLKEQNFNFKMLFVGSGQDEEKLKEKIKQYGLQDNIILCGKISDRDELAKYYARADLFLFPSLYDASSIVQIEAASQETPTMFVEGSATSATVKNNINGFITKNDINEYSNKIKEVIEDKELYKKVSKNAYKDLYKNWDDTIKEVFERYKKIIEDKANE